MGSVVLSARCRVLIGRQIGALSKGFLVGRSTAGHLILLECGQALAGPHSRCQISISCCCSSSSTSAGSSSCLSAAASLGYIFTKNNKAVRMTSSTAAGEGYDSRAGGCGWVGVWRRTCLGLALKLNITAWDDLIHKAHYASLRVLIVRSLSLSCLY